MIKLLPYQERSLTDRPRFKVLMWSRGARKTFTVTLEVVHDCFLKESKGKRTTWVILSRGERQAKEAIEECKRHCLAFFKGAAKILESEFISEDGQRRFVQLEIRFPNGSRILALPANPDTARGYSANVVLDEFSIHEKDVEIWRSLLPVLRGRFRIIVASTPKGGRTRKFFQIINDQSIDKKTGNPFWSKHIVDVYEAVKQGLPLDIETERSAMGDPDGWAQEFELQWLDEASAWLPFELIESCEDEEASIVGDGYQGGPCYIGNDIARRKDLWVAWVLEECGDVLWTREVVTLTRPSFAEQDQAIADLFNRYKVSRMSVDQTGMGEKPVEDYQRTYGASRVEGVLFNPNTKQGLATIGRQSFEKRTVRIPSASDIRNDLYKLKRTTTNAGSVRFDATRDEQGHADRAWSLFLALNAASQGVGSIDYESVTRRTDWDDALGFGRSRFTGY